MAKKQNPQILSPANYVRQRARSLPLFRCFINEEWEDSGMQHIIIARKHISGNITFCSYLVDTQCLGIKDSIFDFNIPEKDFEEHIDKVNLSGITLMEAGYDLVHNIIHAAWKFAEEIGFQPCKIFLSTTQYMLEEDDDIPYIEIHCGDEEGKPLYIQGELDDEAKANMIIRKLEKNVGIGNFDYFLKSDWDEEEEEDWEDEDDEDWDEDDWDEDDWDENDEDDGWYEEEDEEWEEEDEEERERKKKIEYNNFYNKFSKSSLEKNARAFLDFSAAMDELFKEEWSPNVPLFQALVDVLYKELTDKEEVSSWMEKWEHESALYTVSDAAYAEMLGLKGDEELSEEDTAHIRNIRNISELKRYVNKRWGETPFSLYLELTKMSDSPRKREKIKRALKKYPDHSFLRMQALSSNIPDEQSLEEAIGFKSIFHERKEITPDEFLQLIFTRMACFLHLNNLAGMESLTYFSEKELNETIGDTFFRASFMMMKARVSLLRNYLQDHFENEANPQEKGEKKRHRKH